MAAKNVTIKGLQLRHSTAADWRSKNPTLKAGEVGIETDTLKIKVGIGETTWNSLAYANEQDLSGYLLASAAASTYATKNELGNYLSISVAATTYALKADTYTKNEVAEMLQAQAANSITDISVADNKLTWTRGNGTTGSFDLGNIKWG